MAGAEESTIDSRLEQLEKILDEYENSVGMKLDFTQDDVNENESLLAVSLSRAKNLTPRECGEYAVALQRYATYLQKLINKEQSRVTWAEESIKKIIAPRLQQQRGSSYEERKMSAIRENDAAQKLDRIRVNAQIRINRLGFLPTRIDAIARALGNMQQRRE